MTNKELIEQLTLLKSLIEWDLPIDYQVVIDDVIEILKGKNMDIANDILHELKDSEVLCQLAEECAELAQAALKHKRSMSSINPTVKSSEQCFESVIEEAGDVVCCLKVLGLYDSLKVNRIAEEKLMRWYHRLELDKK